MFDTVLVANRGEIAVRIIRTLRRLGIRSIAVYSDADVHARHVAEADHALRIGPAGAAESYLSIPDVIRAAVDSGAQAVHPGYGFLAENADFARACRSVGVVFIGPPTQAIEAMGDKIEATSVVSAAGVPVIAGDPAQDDVAVVAENLGYPLLVKPVVGGGGKGMRRVDGPGELVSVCTSARREAKAAFGDDRLLLERVIPTPRHIEIQILADHHGNVVHLGDRECSLQRRHQKILEEAPSILLDEDLRTRMGDAAVAAAQAVDYRGAGTVEFLVPAEAPDQFCFLEMNTRLQVEHPVTELVTGLDLVEWQLRIACGERLPFRQGDVCLDGHAVEARVYAEDPTRDFLPTGGTVLELGRAGGPGIRVDSGLHSGTVVGSEYDPLLAKVIAWGEDRTTALRRLDRALADTAVLGVPTNVDFLRALVHDPDVRAGRIDTGLVERKRDHLVADAVSEEFLLAGALDRLLALQPAGPVVDLWDIPDGWRLGGNADIPFRLQADRVEAFVRVTGRPDKARVSIDGADPVAATAERDGSWLIVHCDGAYRRYRRAQEPDGPLWLAREGRTVAITERPHLPAGATKSIRKGPVTSPMPGTVLMTEVVPGDVVSAGDCLLVVEAMKMEYSITAPVSGVVSALHVHQGQQVASDQPLVLITPEEAT